MATKRVVWREGTLLRPQHLQQQQRYLEDQAHLRTALVQPYGWGLSAIDIDEDLLARGEFSIRLVTAIFPDGLLVKIGPDQPCVPQRSVVSYFERGQEELLVFLALPQSAAKQQTTDPAALDPYAARYESSIFELPDATSPGQSASIELAWPKLNLVMGEEAQSHANLLPIAKIIRQEQGYRLDPTFIPPCLTLRASTGLDLALRALLAKAHERLQDLKKARSQRDDKRLSFEPQDLQRYLWLTALSGSIATLESMLHSQGTSPYAVYLELVRWAGQLACLRQDPCAPSRQGYIHVRAHASFEPVFDQLFDLLDACVNNDYQLFELTRRSDGMWLAKIDELSEQEQNTFVLAVKSNEGYEHTARKLPALAKLASFSQISKVIDHAVPGAELSYLPRPPSTIPIQSDWAYFSIQQDSRYWSDILKNQCIAFYAGSPFDGEDTQIRIYSTSQARKPQLRLA